MSDPSLLFPIGVHLFDDRFAPLVHVFRSNFAHEWERRGASFAVFYKGKPAIHLWGGQMSEDEDWKEDTMSVLFSTTKCLAAIVLAWTLQENNVDEDMPLIEVWPEMDGKGREELTIRDVLLHRSGILFGQTALSREDAEDHKLLSRWFEDAESSWPCGSRVGYHALSFGMLIDQIVRRIDSKGRGVWQIMREDLLAPHKVDDLSIGLVSEEDNKRVATLFDPDDLDRTVEGERNAEALRRYDSCNEELLQQLYDRLPWLNPTSEDYNKLENRTLSMASNMGIGTTFAVAKFLSLVTNGKILTEETLNKMKQPELVDEMDIVNGYPESKGHGFQYTKNARDEWIFGHSGLGGQNVRMDVKNDLAFAYLCNGMKIADADLVLPWKSLQDALYRILESEG